MQLDPILLPRRAAIHAGVILAQIGELSFLLAAVGIRAGIITDFAYQATVATIALTLTLSPAWVLGVRRLTRPVPEA